MPGYSGYDSTRSKVVSARTRSTSNSGTKTASSPAALIATPTGPLGGEEVEAREVLDVAVVEEDAAGQAHALEELEQPRAPGLELGGGDAGQELHSANSRPTGLHLP